MIKSVSIGTSATRVLGIVSDLYADILIFNNSANIVYLISDPNQSTSDGIPIHPNKTYCDDHRSEDVYLIADGASSDVRIEWNFYKKPRGSF